MDRIHAINLSDSKSDTQDLESCNKEQDKKNLVVHESKFCRFCGPRLEKETSVKQSRNTLIMPCKCTRTRHKYAHPQCLISWINSKRVTKCCYCCKIFNSKFCFTPMSTWEVDPRTRKKAGTYASWIFVGILLLTTDCFIIYLTSFLFLSLLVEIFVDILLSALLISCLIFGITWGYRIYLDVLIYNCDVSEVNEFEMPKYFTFKAFCFSFLRHIM